MSDKESGTPKGFNDDNNGILSGDPKVTCEASKGLDGSFNDSRGLDIGDDKKEQDVSGSMDSNGQFNDRAGL